MPQDTMIRLCDLLREDLIVADLRAEDKDGVFVELIDHLVGTRDLPAGLRDDALESVRLREDVMPTGMEEGVAIPHGVIEGIDDVIAVLGLSRRGVPFGAMDGWPAYVVVLILTPPNLLMSHVRTLAGIARLLNDARTRDALRQAVSAREAFDRINSAGM